MFRRMMRLMGIIEMEGLVEGRVNALSTKLVKRVERLPALVKTKALN